MYWNFDDLGIDLETDGLLNALIQTIDDLKIGLDDADLLNGSEKNNLLIGLDGNDYLNGGYGADVISGGAGADIFAFEAVSEFGDLIRDFDSSDRILLNNLLLASGSTSIDVDPSKYIKFTQAIDPVSLMKTNSDIELTSGNRKISMCS